MLQGIPGAPVKILPRLRIGFFGARGEIDIGKLPRGFFVLGEPA